MDSAHIPEVINTGWKELDFSLKFLRLGKVRIG
jgi:hypothetical protein